MPVGTLQLRQSSLHSILGWWADELGINVPELAARADGVTISASVNLPGIVLFRRGDDLRVVALAHKLRKIEETVIGSTPAEIFTGGFWRRHLPEWCGNTAGPALFFYTDARPPEWGFTPPEGIRIHAIGTLDEAVFDVFAGALTRAELENSGLDHEQRLMWGAYAENDLVALAGYDSWPARIAHIGVAVHPDHRGRGLGKAMAKAAARGALLRRRIVQYRAPAGNPGAVGIARALGLELFAETLFVRPPEVK